MLMTLQKKNEEKLILLAFKRLESNDLIEYFERAKNSVV